MQQFVGNLKVIKESAEYLFGYFAKTAIIAVSIVFIGGALGSMGQQTINDGKELQVQGFIARPGRLLEAKVVKVYRINSVRWRIHLEVTPNRSIDNHIFAYSLMPLKPGQKVTVEEETTLDIQGNHNPQRNYWVISPK